MTPFNTGLSSIARNLSNHGFKVGAGTSKITNVGKVEAGNRSAATEIAAPDIKASIGFEENSVAATSAHCARSVYWIGPLRNKTYASLKIPVPLLKLTNLSLKVGMTCARIWALNFEAQSVESAAQFAKSESPNSSIQTQSKGESMNGDLPFAKKDRSCLDSLLDSVRSVDECGDPSNVRNRGVIRNTMKMNASERKHFRVASM